MSCGDMEHVEADGVQIVGQFPGSFDSLHGGTFKCQKKPEPCIWATPADRAQAGSMFSGEVCVAQAECLFVATLQDKDKEVRLRAAASLTKLGGLYTQQIAEALAMALEGLRMFEDVSGSIPYEVGTSGHIWRIFFPNPFLSSISRRSDFELTCSCLSPRAMSLEDLEVSKLRTAKVGPRLGQDIADIAHSTIRKATERKPVPAMPRPNANSGSSWMMELTQEVERLQQQVENLGRNSQTLRELVTQVDAFAIPPPPSAPKDEVSPVQRPPSLPGSKRPSSEDFRPPGPPGAPGALGPFAMQPVAIPTWSKNIQKSICPVNSLGH
eukprot:s464_g6.t1